MSTPDKNGWVKGLENADPEGGTILVCFPPNANDEVEYDFADWEPVTGRWECESWHPEDASPTYWQPLNFPVEYSAEEAA